MLFRSYGDEGRVREQQVKGRFARLTQVALGSDEAVSGRGNVHFLLETVEARVELSKSQGTGRDVAQEHMCRAAGSAQLPYTNRGHASRDSKSVLRTGRAGCEWVGGGGVYSNAKMYQN